MKGPETAKSDKRRQETGFYEVFMSGYGLDIGYRGSLSDAEAEPVLPGAIGVELNYAGYDGRTLPFGDESQDYVFSSHCLEHIEDYKQAIQEWYRVTKIGGFIIIIVPHKFLYEKKDQLPSRWNGDHKRFYTPASVMSEVENALQPNTYRVKLLQDCDEQFDYTIPPEEHSGGEYQIELVIQKIEKPKWEIK